MQARADRGWRAGLLALVAAMLLAFTAMLLAPVPVLADEPEEELVTVTVEFRLYQDGTPPEAPEEASLEPQEDYGTDYASARAALNTGLMNADEEIYLHGFRVHKDEVATLIAQVTNDNPDLFYVHGRAQVSYYESTGLVHHIVPVYAYDAADIPSMKSAYYAALDDVLSWIPDGATDVQKVKAVHDWLVRYCNYNYEAEAAGHDNYEHDPWCAYGALVTHDPVCQGYALAFRAAMRALGIPCDYVEQWESETSGHAWNRVYLVVDGEGAWYNLDVTHDDPGGSFSTTPSTTYFLKSDDWFRANPSGSWHTTWDPAGVAGTDTRFDGYAQADWPTYAGPASVQPAVPTAFELSATELLLETYSEADVTVASVEPEGASWYDRTWTSSDPAVAAVDRAGHVSCGGTTGTAVLTCTIGGVSRVVDVTVVARDLSNATIETLPDVTYDGTEHTPEPVVSYRGRTLVKGTDYTVSYADNVNAGTATVTISAKSGGPYVGTNTATFQIDPMTISGAAVSAIPAQPYTGTAVTPEPVVALGGVAFLAGTDYTVSYRDNTNAGTATVTVTGTGNYTGTVSATFQIVPAQLSHATVASIPSHAYTGKAVKPAPVVKVGGVTLRAGTDYTVSYARNTNVGTVTVTITGKGNYQGSISRTFQIVPMTISGAAVSAIPAQPYTGKAVKPAPVVKVGGVTLKAGTDYTLSYSNNTKAGTATITITGKGNYKGTKTVTFKIVAPSVTYRTHVQKDGWQSWRKDGAMAGTSGRSLRLEGINIKLAVAPYSGGITYRVHVQRIGWQGWRSDGAMAGTSGQSLRLEAIEIKLTGEMAQHYDVYYRVHAQHFGWMGWAKNGQSCGSAGYGYRLEGIEIRIVPKGGKAPGSTAGRFHQK